MQIKDLDSSVSRRPGVAVVITTYNDTRYLREAILSVLAQEIAATEIFLVDDGSEVSPAAIVSEFPQVVLLRKENGGPSSARNLALRAATAQFITFLDADDRYRPGAISAGLRCFDANPSAAMVYGAHVRISADGRQLHAPVYHLLQPDSFTGLLRGNLIGMLATVLFRTEILLQSGGFDENIRHCEDFELYLRLATNHVIASHSEVVAEYRWHGKNTSLNTKKMLEAALSVHGQYRDQTGDRAIAWQQGQLGIKRWYYAELMQSWGDGRHYTSKEKAMRKVVRIRSRIKGVLHRFAPGLLRALTGGSYSIPLHGIRFGDLGTPKPICDNFGWPRGTPIDRYYIDEFLRQQAQAVAGSVLEVGEDLYSRQYGGARVTRQDIVHVDPSFPTATIRGDISVAGVLPTSAFDCIIFTQTLQYILDLDSAILHLHDALKPGGVLLLTVPGISQLDVETSKAWCWSFTATSIRGLFAKRFAADNMSVEVRGNVFAAICGLTGAVLEELDTSKLDPRDPAYPVIVSLRAQRAS